LPCPEWHVCAAVESGWHVSGWDGRSGHRRQLRKCTPKPFIIGILRSNPNVLGMAAGLQCGAGLGLVSRRYLALLHCACELQRDRGCTNAIIGRHTMLSGCLDTSVPVTMNSLSHVRRQHGRTVLIAGRLCTVRQNKKSAIIVRFAVTFPFSGATLAIRSRDLSGVDRGTAALLV